MTNELKIAAANYEYARSAFRDGRISVAMFDAAERAFKRAQRAAK